MPGNNLRYHILFSGIVQGVGFRFTARNIAQQYSVNGWVRNLKDNKVEVLVEGPSGSLMGFLSDLKHQFRNGITHCEVKESKASGEFSKFEIYA